MRRKLLAIVLLTMSFGWIASDSHAAKKKALPLESFTCGVPVTHSFRLIGDKLCANTALVIAKAGITIDLNGKTITGQGMGGGALIKESYVTLRNGTIENFSQAVVIDGDTNVRIRRLKLSGNSSGIFATGNSHEVRKNRLVSNKTAMHVIMPSSNMIVRKNLVAANHHYGLAFTGSSGHRVLDNTISGNGYSGLTIAGDGFRVSGNTISYNGHNQESDGMVVSWGANGLISDNRIEGNGRDGIRDEGSSNTTFRDNALLTNGFFQGQPDSSGRGIDAFAASTPKGSGNSSDQNDAYIPCLPVSLCK